jgi:hypothetical protein
VRQRLISASAFVNLLKEMINQHEWLQSRKKLLEQVKSQVQIRLGPLPFTLRQYAKNLEHDFKSGWRPSSSVELDRALAKAKVVLSADFHAYAQSQRAHIRLLRDHLPAKSVVLALECLNHEDEEAAAAFLSGELSESKFLEVIEWNKTWGFPWENYRPLFELARDRGFTVRGLNRARQGSLRKRDAWTAERILNFHTESPAATIFVVIGEWHLASAHLPKRLTGKLFGNGDLAVVHQDVEQLYFRLAKKNSESKIEVLKARGGRFCLMVSPPWMKWQSYLMFLEQAYDRDLQEDLAIDYTDHVVSLIEVLESDLKIQTKKSSVQVYCANSKTSLGRLRLSLSPKQERALVYHLQHDQSFFIPQKGWLYLSRPTINHASGLAGQHVHAYLSRRQRTLWDLPADFLPLIWIEAVGFFFSKWINPKRKAETLENIRVQLAASHPQERGASALLLALDHRLSEVLWVKTGRMRRTSYKPRESSAYLDAARIVGSMLGERLFQKVRSRTISLPKLMSYLRVGVDRKDFSKFYWKLIREIEHDQSL